MIDRPSVHALVDVSLWREGHRERGRWLPVFALRMAGGFRRFFPGLTVLVTQCFQRVADVLGEAGEAIAQGQQGNRRAVVTVLAEA